VWADYTVDQKVAFILSRLVIEYVLKLSQDFHVPQK